MRNYGATTGFTITTGLLATLCLLLWPGQAHNAIWAILVTPLAAAVATGTELLSRGKVRSGLMLYASVALIIVTVALGWR